MQRQLPKEIKRPLQDDPSQLPFLPAMERTVALIPKAFSGSESLDTLVPAPLDEAGARAHIRCRRLLQPGPRAICLARHAGGHGLLHRLHCDRLAGAQYLGRDLLHHRALHHRLIAAETSPAARRRVHRRHHLWHGSAGFRAPIPRLIAGFTVCSRQ